MHSLLFAICLVAEIQVSQRSALPQHCGKTLCPSYSNFIVNYIVTVGQGKLRDSWCGPAEGLRLDGFDEVEDEEEEEDFDQCEEEEEEEED